MSSSVVFCLLLLFHCATGIRSEAGEEVTQRSEEGDSTSLSEEECLPCGDEGEEGGGFMQDLLGTGVAEKGLQAGVQAPRFALRPLDGEQVVRSAQLFAARPLTVLIFWDSYCRDCLRAVVQCGKFAREVDSLGVGLLSVNFDYEHMAAVRAFVKGEELPFPVLWDAERQVVLDYQAIAHDFSLLLVDRQEKVRGVHYGRPREPLELLRSEVGRVLEAIEEERAQRTSPGQ